MSRELFDKLVPHGHEIWDALPGHDAQTLNTVAQSLNLYINAMGQANGNQIRDGVFVPGTARLLYVIDSNLEWKPHWHSILFDLGTNTVCAYSNSGIETLMPISGEHLVTLSYMDNLAILPGAWEYVLRNSL